MKLAACGFHGWLITMQVYNASTCLSWPHSVFAVVRVARGILIFSWTTFISVVYLHIAFSVIRIDMAPAKASYKVGEFLIIYIRHFETRSSRSLQYNLQHMDETECSVSVECGSFLSLRNIISNGNRLLQNKPCIGVCACHVFK